MAVSPAEALAEEVRAEVRTRGVDPQREPVAVRLLAEEATRRHERRSLTGAVAPLADEEGALGEIVARVSGLGVLQPLIDDGTLVVKSGQTDIEQAATLRWDGETAQSRMEDILTANYSDGTQVDAVLSPYDGISRGIISALTDAGYSVGEEWPIISGQDAEVDSVKAILSGEQFATIFKDTR